MMGSFGTDVALCRRRFRRWSF